MAAMAMQTATFESTYPIMNKIMWGRNYEAMLSTPLQIRNIVLRRAGLVGLPDRHAGDRLPRRARRSSASRSRRWRVLAIPFTILIGLAFSSCLIAFTATQKNDVGFSAVFRFIINPLFLFSGTFFPLTQLPEPLQVVAWLTPLFHGVELVRGSILGTLEPLRPLLHLAYLLVMFGIGALPRRAQPDPADGGLGR